MRDVAIVLGAMVIGTALRMAQICFADWRENRQRIQRRLYESIRY